jgi:hypothetical protein
MIRLRSLVLAFPLLGLLLGSRDATAEPAPGTPPRHWSFDPPREPQVPPVRDRSWPRSPIDQFILAGLEGRGLLPGRPADKRTLIRRATFDLTGLPPTPDEIEAFLADPSPDAFAKVVDRLLASPAYGEHWGRHWLDVARYADSNGLDENVAHGNAPAICCRRRTRRHGTNASLPPLSSPSGRKSWPSRTRKRWKWTSSTSRWTRSAAR